MNRSLLHERENSYFEEEMATTFHFGEGQFIDTHFCQWLVSISLHSTFASNISTKKYQLHIQPRALAELGDVSCRTSEQPNGFGNGVKVTLVIQRPYKTLNFVAVISMSLTFFTSCTRRRTFVFNNSLRLILSLGVYSFQFPHLGLILI